MCRTITWFKAHRIAVLEHVQHKKSSCAPSMLWWILIIAIENIYSVAYIASKTLQGQTTLVSQQRESLENLVATLTDDFDVRHFIYSDCKALGYDKNSIVSDDGRVVVSVDILCGFLEYLGTFFFYCVEVL